jgi:hypothetical protein
MTKRRARLLAILLTSAPLLAACGSAPPSDDTATENEALLVRPCPACSICGFPGGFPCANPTNNGCQTGLTPSGNPTTCTACGALGQPVCGYGEPNPPTSAPCNPAYRAQGNVCVLDQSVFNVELPDSIFGVTPVRYLDDITLSITNNTVTVDIPQTLPFTGPPPSSFSPPSGSQAGINYSATVGNPGLTMDNWNWSANGPIEITADLHGQLSLSFNLDGAFGCTVQATLSDVPNVDVFLQVVNGTTTVQSATVTLLDNNTINYAGNCTWAGTIGSTTITSKIQGAIEQQLTSQFNSLFASNSGAFAWSNMLSQAANSGIVGCVSGDVTPCPAGAGFGGSHLPAQGSGWYWNCLAVDTSPGNITGTCWRE